MRFNWFKKTRKDSILSELSDLLFPQLNLEIVDSVKVMTDYSVDANLEAVLTDVIHGKTTQVTIKSLEYVIRRLTKARDMLEANRFWTNGVIYYAVKSERQKDVSANEVPLDAEEI